MKKKIAVKWAEALRSGKYKQGRRALKRKSKGGVVRHCCLGVLCELYQQEHKTKLKVKTEAGCEELPGEIFTFDGNDAGLPEKVMRWSGVRDDLGAIEGCSLSEENDDGRSFKQIAKIIEESWEEF